MQRRFEVFGVFLAGSGYSLVSVGRDAASDESLYSALGAIYVYFDPDVQERSSKDIPRIKYRMRVIQAILANYRVPEQ